MKKSGQQIVLPTIGIFGGIFMVLDAIFVLRMEISARIIAEVALGLLLILIVSRSQELRKELERHQEQEDRHEAD